MMDYYRYYYFAAINLTVSQMCIQLGGRRRRRSDRIQLFNCYHFFLSKLIKTQFVTKLERI